ncbi:hypothetical protein Sfulv_00660 [Streptomyces fulvorobeus]|uniref:Uncharacterized protein n=1 Tax=Streptomyces fulvorobeus TaxID=284028 RepID=A0A7J0BYE8_9ACTN|nr:hypothetical protein Sfulv_00660 [Streptomyces fulvorobeus]
MSGGGEAAAVTDVDEDAGRGPDPDAELSAGAGVADVRSKRKVSAVPLFLRPTRLIRRGVDLLPRT